MRMITALGVVGLMACTEPVETKVNTAPYFTDISASPAEGITTSTELICIANALDDENDTLTLTYRWVTSDGTVLANTDTVLLTPDTVQPNDELTCNAMVSDGTDTASTSVTVTLDNTAPEISSVSISPETVLIDSLLQCSFEASDADGEELTVSYSWTQNGTEVGTGASLQLDADNFSDDDEITCTVTVEDGFGGSATESAVVFVGNTAPSIGSVTLNPETAISTDDITCVVADVVDLEGDEVSISYEWTIDGEVQTETSNMLAGPFAVNSEIICTATPNDTKVDGASASASLVIENTTPVVDAVVISPNINVEANTLLTCAGTVSDIDNETLTTSYAWTFNGTVMGTDATWQLDAATVSPDDVLTCTVTVEDIHGASDMASAAITVVNTAPVVDTAAMVSGDTGVGSILMCEASFSDLNDGTLTPSYEWTVNGSSVGTGMSYTIDANSVITGNYVVCTATAVDSDGASVSSSDAITVTNSAPFLSGVSISPNPILSTSDVMCSVANYGDADGDTVNITYNWTVDGTMQSEHGAALMGPFSVGSNIACEAVPNDGIVDGSSEAVIAMVSNSLPMVDSVELDSDPVLTDGVVTATDTLSDIDVEQTVTATYEWFVNGTSVQSGSMNTLDGSFFSKGDEVYVTVTPNDGMDDGAAVTSAAITIDNTAPMVDSVTLATVSATSTDLLCDVVASDIDGDSLEYTYEWSVNGSVQSETSDTFTGPFVYDEEITCTVTASDVDGLTATANASTTVINTAPVVDSVELDSDPVYTDGVVTATDTLSDVDGHTVTATYEWFVNGTSVQSGSMNTLDGSFFSKGDEVYVTVTPNDGMTDGAAVTSASITIANTMPTVDSVTVTPAGPSYNDSVLTCDAVVTDPDETPTLTYSWSIGSAEVGTAATLDLSQVGAMPMDVVECTVLATDSDNADDIGMDSRALDNREPTISGLAISPNTDVTTSTALTCGFTSADLDGESLTETVMWTVGANIYTGTTLTLDPSMVNPGETVTCEVLVDDNFGGSALDTVSVTVINTAPVFDVAASISPSTVYANSTVSCSGTVSDADGETAGMTYLWENVTTGMTLGTTDTITLTTSDAAKDDNIQCTITATDGTDSVDSVANVTVMNSVPTIDSLSLSPALIYTNTDVQAVATGSDLEGSVLTWNYTWFVDGTQVQDGSADTLASTFFVKDQIVSVDVTVNDGDDTSATQSDSETVSNSVPTAPVVSISPTDPVEGVDDLICSVDTASTDADGDAITYTFEWTVDGTAYTGATDTAMDSVVSAAEIVADEVWECTVTADDGVDLGTSSIDSVIVTTPQTLYNIDFSMLVNLNGSCNYPSTDHVYNDCFGDYGFTWLDTGTVQPSSLTVVVNRSISCSFGSSVVKLNGTAVATVIENSICYCPIADELDDLQTIIVSDTSAFNVGGNNSIMIESQSCDGLGIHSSFPTGIYSQVTQDY